jgi:hypothetical protein
VAARSERVNEGIGERGGPSIKSVPAIDARITSRDDGEVVQQSGVQEMG